jgi:crotonobetainyl-CoA:carnitine CoA-transferase CaiB-like acyl-CoA transferase
VHSLDEIITHRQVAHRGILQEAATPYGPVTLIGPAFRMAHDEGRVGAVAALGEHTDAVLAEAGYDPQAIAALHAIGII